MLVTGLVLRKGSLEKKTSLFHLHRNLCTIRPEGSKDRKMTGSGRVNLMGLGGKTEPPWPRWTVDSWLDGRKSLIAGLPEGRKQSSCANMYEYLPLPM